jgi:hypothetical protein
MLGLTPTICSTGFTPNLQVVCSYWTWPAATLKATLDNHELCHRTDDVTYYCRRNAEGTYSLDSIEAAEQAGDSSVLGSETNSRHGKLIRQSDNSGSAGEGKRMHKALVLPKVTDVVTTDTATGKKSKTTRVAGFKSTFKYFYRLANILKPTPGDGSMMRLGGVGAIVIARIWLSDRMVQCSLSLSPLCRCVYVCVCVCLCVCVCVRVCYGVNGR